MKDIPHHIKKLNRKVIRSEHRLESEDVNYASELPSPPEWTKRPKEERRKLQKREMREEREKHVPSDLTPEERNQKMKHRVPIFERRSHEKPPSSVKPPKKSPKI